MRWKRSDISILTDSGLAVKKAAPSAYIVKQAKATAGVLRLTMGRTIEDKSIRTREARDERHEVTLLLASQRLL